MRLNEIDYFPEEIAGWEDVLPFCEIFADRFYVCPDCPEALRAKAAQYCAKQKENQKENIRRANAANFIGR